MFKGPRPGFSLGSSSNCVTLPRLFKEMRRLHSLSLRAESAPPCSWGAAGGPSAVPGFTKPLPNGLRSFLLSHRLPLQLLGSLPLCGRADPGRASAVLVFSPSSSGQLCGGAVIGPVLQMTNLTCKESHSFFPRPQFWADMGSNPGLIGSPGVAVVLRGGATDVAELLPREGLPASRVQMSGSQSIPGPEPDGA